MTESGLSTLHRRVPKVAGRIAHLGPGPAAALRRGPARGSGTAAYWQLVAPLEDEKLWGEGRGWETVIQSIAILTPRGHDPKKKKKESSHDPSVAMGTALYNARFSELRLARMLNAPPATRRRLVVRACRRLSASGHHRFDLVTLAWFVLTERNEPARRIARDYYRAEAMARRSTSAS